MADIGAQLREARTRARIEIAQMEAQTKIRAKYLRALENEEWELLPGPTYVKSFLRTYGDMLGLDGRQLVTDYKNAHEPFHAEGDIGQMSKHTGGRMNRQQAGPPLPRLVLVGVVLAALVGGGAYYALGRDDGGSVTATTPDETVDGSSPDAGSGQDEAEQTPAGVVVRATGGTVTVCLRAGRRIAVPETELRSGESTDEVRGRSVVMTADSRSIQLRVNGEREALPSGSGPITVVVTNDGVRRAGDDVTGCRV